MWLRAFIFRVPVVLRAWLPCPESGLWGDLVTNLGSRDISAINYSGCKAEGKLIRYRGVRWENGERGELDLGEKRGFGLPSDQGCLVRKYLVTQENRPVSLGLGKVEMEMILPLG